MKAAGERADISALAALIGEPARARMLTALMGGTALTATELALRGGVTPSTASTHLAKLTDARILKVARQGRHRYFHLFDEDVATMVESLMGVAARHPIPRATIRPKPPSPRHVSVMTTSPVRPGSGWPIVFEKEISSPAATRTMFRQAVSVSSESGGSIWIH